MKLECGRLKTKWRIRSVIILHRGESIGSAPSGRIAVVPAKRAGTVDSSQTKFGGRSAGSGEGSSQDPAGEAQNVTAVSDALTATKSELEKTTADMKRTTGSSSPPMLSLHALYASNCDWFSRFGVNAYRTIW